MALREGSGTHCVATIYDTLFEHLLTFAYTSCCCMHSMTPLSNPLTKHTGTSVFISASIPLDTTPNILLDLKHHLLPVPSTPRPPRPSIALLRNIVPAPTRTQAQQSCSSVRAAPFFTCQVCADQQVDVDDGEQSRSVQDEPVSGFPDRGTSER